VTALLLDAEALYSQLLVQMRQLVAAEQALHGAAPLLVGVASGGAWLAQRLQRDLGLAGSSGVLSSNLHRDDFSQRGLSSGAQTRLPLAIDGAHVLVIDDVLYTGRTLRAVLNELFDYGRPASVKLAVLVDRGGRELPVQPDFAAARITLPSAQSLDLALLADGSFSFQVQDAGSASAL
jgi:pyrimidine operon attenuation protein / uracil phosphoribosyltransferase